MSENDRQLAEIIKLSPELYSSQENVAARRRIAAEAESRKLDTVRPPEDTHEHFLYITTQGGQPVIFENRDGRRLTNKQMLYPPPGHRDYYQVGDVILIDEFEERRAEYMFPELAPESEDQPSLLYTLGKAFLGVKAEKLKIGHKIGHIDPTGDGTGSGQIRTHIVLFLGRNDIVEMDVEREFSRGELADDFIRNIYGPKAEVADFLESYCEFLTDVVGGLEKETIGTLTRWGVQKAASYAAKKEGKHLIGEWFKSALGKESKLLAKAIYLSGKKFTSSILSQNEKRESAARFPAARVEPLNVSSAVSEACMEFAKTLIEGQWEVLLPSITKKLGKWLKVDEL